MRETSNYSKIELFAKNIDFLLLLWFLPNVYVMLKFKLLFKLPTINYDQYIVFVNVYIQHFSLHTNQTEQLQIFNLLFGFFCVQRRKIYREKNYLFGLTEKN